MNERDPNAPDLWDIVGNVTVYFTNSDPLIDFPKPTLPTVVDLGGIGLREAHPLDKEWSEIVSRRKQNVLISFGSVVPSTSMHPQMKANLLKVIKSNPEVTFIWKYSKPDEEGFSMENLVVRNWVPQNDLMASGFLTAFVTHAGLGSTIESAAHGVVTINVPLFADQPRNAKMIERLGCGFVLSKNDLLNYDKVEAAIRRGLTDKSLQEKATDVRRTVERRPFPPSELLVRNIELALDTHVIKRRPKGADLSFFVYYNLDILLYALISVFTILIILGYLISRFVCSLSKVKTD